MKNAESGKKKTFLRYAVLILLGLLLGLNVYLLSVKNVTGNRMPMPFGIGLAVVQSGSMEPACHKGDILFVKAQSDYAVGDIVVYQSRGILVVHRIIAADGETVITRGDANNVPDEPFGVTNIKGVVTGSIPGAGYAIDFMKTLPGILLLIGCAVALVELPLRRDKKALRIQLLREEIERIKKELSETKNNTENKN